MYLRYFGFDSYPFSVTPDPAFLYLSASHREALAHLLYGAGEHGGFVSLIGEVGTGKTTLIRAVADSELSDLDIALCWNPQLDVKEFIATVCDELGVAAERHAGTSVKSLIDRLNTHLLATHAENRRTVLILDEAQNLSRDVLEQLRLLTNLETHKHKLLRIILVGQPELSDLLARHDLRQLAQRITARSVLQPLGYGETRAYIQHRLECANGPQYLFSKPATTAIRLLTGGVPRLINMVCERALMGAYAHGRSHIGLGTVIKAAGETLPRRRSARAGRWWRLAVPGGLAATALVILGLAWLPEIPLTSAAEWMNGGTKQTTQSVETVDEAADNLLSQNSVASASSGSAGDAAAKRGSAANVAANKAQPVPGSSGEATEKKPADASKTKGAAAEGDSDRKQRGDKVVAVDNAKTPAPSDTIPDGNADMNQLLRLWGVFGAEVHAQCSTLHVGDLRCLADTGGLDRVRRYNRPALLTLEHDGQQQTVMLTALTRDKATLVGGNGTRDVTLAALKARWNGEFRIIWRADAGVRLIRPGSVGNAVVWLRDRLDRIDGENPDNHAGKPSPVYDDALGERLKAFQKSRGLDPDGLAGPRTQMMLNGSVPSPGTPALRPVASSRK